MCLLSILSEKQKFLLRAHTYQARSLIGSDASGLSGNIRMTSAQVVSHSLPPGSIHILNYVHLLVFAHGGFLGKANKPFANDGGTK